MRMSRRTKSNDSVKILRMISRDEELIRNDGKFVQMNRTFKNKKKYDRKQSKKELGKALNSYFLSFRTDVLLPLHFLLMWFLFQHVGRD